MAQNKGNKKRKAVRVISATIIIVPRRLGNTVHSVIRISMVAL
jgi:hypothetical protein